MSLEELWQLFPIILTESNPSWKDWFEEEKEYLEKVIGENVLIHHIGSTAIEGIWAKPIVDILIEVENREKMCAYARLIEENGYIIMNENQASRISLNKGYTKFGFAEKVFHVHLRMIGDNNELYFRDYLNSHFDIAKEYEELKLLLWKKFEYDRDGYTEAKTEFIKKYTEKGKSLYGKK